MHIKIFAIRICIITITHICPLTRNQGTYHTEALHNAFITVKVRIECVSIWSTQIILCVCVCVFSHVRLCSPGSSVHGILLARILEWVVISYSIWLSRPRNQTCISCISCIGLLHLLHWKANSLPTVPPGEPTNNIS